MYKRQVCLFWWGYMINDNENEAENKKDIIRYDINRPRPRHGQKYTKYKMVICIKQHLSNNWSSIHEKIKQHWGWVEKNRCL